MLGWLNWPGEKGYMSWGVNNIFLTPAHDYIHNWIRDWTQEWDPDLNMSTVWPNCRQGIIAMLSGGTLVRFSELSRGERTKVETLEWCLKALLPCFRLSPYFGFPSFPLFRVSTVWPSSIRGGAKIQAMHGSALSMAKIHNIIVAYPISYRLTIVTKRERMCELGGLESLLNTCVRLDTQLHLILEPGVGSSLEYTYSVTHVAAYGGLV